MNYWITNIYSNPNHQLITKEGTNPEDVEFVDIDSFNLVKEVSLKVNLRN